MNILIDLVPKSVLIDGVNYAINSDFRHSIMFELLMQDNNYSEVEKTAIMLKLYYPLVPENLQKAIEHIMWFYRCGKEIVNNNDNDSKAEDIYSFEYDDDYIYSAFLTQYNIDLQDIHYLHWWKFRALFKGLKEDNYISKIMGFRAMKINKDMSSSDKKYYRKMKNLYKLPDNRNVEEKEREFNNSMKDMF